MQIPPKRALIIGYGNPLRSDDGFGWHAVQELASHLHNPDVEIITRHQLTPELAETASHSHLVILIDAARDLPPGELRCAKVTRSESPNQSEALSFSHFLTPASLLGWTADLYHQFPDAYYISVGGESFTEGESISPVMQAAFEPLIAQVRSLLDQ